MDKQELIKRTQENELIQFLGIKIESVEPERTVLTMDVTPKVHQYIGIMNGGVSLFLSETAASIAAVAVTDLTKFAPVGIEINANHLRAVSKGKITVEAKPLYNGRSMSVWNVEITNEKGKLICISRCSILHRKGAASLR
ncbi:MAG: PaaI family thioesterase [Blastocatellia bacterium]|nr:PaaI family thioesterase [Blastocatellia bacterium]